MKRLATHIIIAIALLAGMAGCTHNNGDIGYWFGLWHLDSIEVNGETDSAYDGKYYFLFQGKVFCLRYVFEQEHDYREAFAQWKESDDQKFVTINFVDNRFTPYLGDDIPANYLSTVTTLTVDTLTSSTMVLHYTRDDGTVITYHLTLWQ
ncbi:MAG: lipocalin-like domain-containing protein [Muribaculaceae bacterium]|nr:lipocalin-like domain-containing protein [Muribaculaceae bacterium]